MDREEAFNEMMETLFEMSRYISVYESTPRRYRTEDLYMTEMHALNLIWNQDRLNMTQLAQQTNRTKGAISQMVEKLRKKGLLVKEKNPQNNSEIFLRLTDLGREACQYHRDMERNIYRLYLDGLEDFGQEDFERYRRLLQRLKQITVEASRRDQKS